VNELSLDQTRYMVGRGPEADINLASMAVSRSHAELHLDPFGHWWLRDLGSSTGTLVNDMPIDEVMVRMGDAVVIGDYELVLYDVVEFMDDDAEAFDPMEGTDLVFGDEPRMTVTSLGDLPDASKIEVIHLAAIKEFGSRLLHTNDAKERARLLCRLMVRKDFHAQSAMVMKLARPSRRKDPQPRPVCEPQFAAGTTGDLPYISRSLMRALFHSNLPTLAKAESDFQAIEMTMIGSQSQNPVVAMACPLSMRGDQMELLYAVFPPKYGDAEWLTLMALAAQHYHQAEMLHKAQNHERQQAAVKRELTQAQEMQRRFLPTRPIAPGLDVAVVITPCRWVGGDYADVIEIDDDHVLLVVGDAHSKGMAAAIAVAAIASMIHAFTRVEMPLQDMIDHLNDYARDRLTEPTCVTLSAVLVERSTGKAQCVRAGHPSPVLVDARATSLIQPEENAPLGAEVAPVNVTEFTLEPGQLLFMFTDGLTHVADEHGEPLGHAALLKRVTEICRANSDAKLQRLSDELTTTLKARLAGRTSQDDRTFLFARRA